MRKRRLFFPLPGLWFHDLHDVQLDDTYSRQIIAGISPLFTVDRSYHLRFINQSFEKEFGVSTTVAVGRPIFEVLPLSFVDKETLLDSLQRPGHRRTQNLQFRYQRRLYGYTVFPVGEDSGIILKNITDIRRLERKVQDLHSRLLRAQEEERQRLAAELHDGVGQTIVAAKINLVAYTANRAKNESRFELALDLIDRASDELREIYSNLYPSVLRELGLAAAIRESLKSLDGASIDVRAEIDIEPLQPDLEVQIYRIVQELIANTMKHSRATGVQLTINIEKKDFVHIQFDDDGKGFDAGKSPDRGFGLQNMRRRVAEGQGRFQLITFPGGGTSVQIHFPVGRSMQRQSSQKAKGRGQNN